jgi:beta-glucanase (GH16 family)
VTVEEAITEQRRSRLVRIGRWFAIGVSIVAAVAVTAVVVVRFSHTARPQAPRSDLSSEGRQMRAEEEFDGPAGAPPNPDYFGYDVGGGGWGNDELQTYTKKSENVRLDGDGKLLIEARIANGSYTSARLVTRGKAEFDFGLIEARIKFPEGVGLHPAFWLLGADILKVGFPLAGEIDVMELVDTGKVYHNAIHGPLDADTSQPWQVSRDGDWPTNLADDFHTYQVYREPGIIKIGIDGKEVGKYTYFDLPPVGRWVFDNPMYLTLNVAVGGKWPGPVGPTTKFPATMSVDWIRYWS